MKSGQVTTDCLNAFLQPLTHSVAGCYVLLL